MASKQEFPYPIIDAKESRSLDQLTEKYKKMIAPGKVAKTVKKVGDLIPEEVKAAGATLGEKITEQELYQRAMELIALGFKTVEEQVAKYTISKDMVLVSINKAVKDADIDDIEEICLRRSYEIAALVNKNKDLSRLYAAVEGALTGAFGFNGLPFNLVFSLLLYFRAVQTIAMYYGYDVQNDSEELIIASNVYTNALSLGRTNGNDELSGLISKVMLLTEATVLKQTAKKTWADMAARGGIPLLLAQMRALANKAAKKALEKAGKKGLEESVFKGVFEQIGKRLTLRSVEKAVPVVSSVIGALIDFAQMDTVVAYADIFYQKRFILEKQERVRLLMNDNDLEE